jgi:amino acid adenylation domain-containing protein
LYVIGYEKAVLDFDLHQAETDKINQLVNNSVYGVFMILFSVVSFLLYRYSNSEELMIFVPTINKSSANDNEIRVIKCRINGFQTYKELLMETKKAVTEAEKNINMQHYDSGDLMESDCIKTIVYMEGIHQTSGLEEFKPDLIFRFYSKGHCVKCSIEYNANIMEKGFVESLAGSYSQIIRQAIASPGIGLAQIEVLSEAARKSILYEVNDTAREYPENRSLNELFEEQVEKSPNKTALIYEDDRLTYRELNSWSNRIAWMLKEKGIKEDMVVGVMAERCLELVAALMGVIKSGAAYVPIDPTYPQERIEYLLKSSKATILLTQDKLKENIKPGESEVISVTGLRCSSDFRTDNLSIEYNPERLLYVLYTSGSTGNPKGVMVKSHSFVNLCTWFADAGDMSEEDTMLLMSSVSFDLTHKNIYAPLLRGGRVCLYRSGLYNYMHMTETAQKESITIMCCTPSVFYPLVELNEDGDYGALSSLRKIFLGGEPLNINRLKKWSKSPNYCAEIINIYGPTECTDIVSLYRIDNGKMDELDNVPIGRPIYNTKLYILDKNLQPVPIGVAGELCVGEVGLARGYYNDEALTAEKFVDTPHLPSKKVYRTGDLVKWLPDINIEFLGRVDFQVKIRGIRIEPGEIENVMLKHPAVKEAVVIAKERRAGDKYLCMYYMLKSQVGEEELREYAKGILPENMVPEFFIKLDSMSMTPSGKIDRKRMPEPNKDSFREKYIAPVTTNEQKIAGLWQEILGVDRIGLEDDFFSLGGDSLKAMLLISRVYKEFNVNLVFGTVFKNLTVKAMVEYINQEIRQNTSGIISNTGYRQLKNYPASSAQKRMFILYSLFPESTGYNTISTYLIRGKLDTGRLEAVFNEIFSRHESFRTAFELSGNDVVQKIKREVHFRIDYKEQLNRKIDDIIDEFIKPFDLISPPFIRVMLISMKSGDHLMVMDIHHIIVDGVSINILLNEITALYCNEKLSPLTIQYKDYALWQEEQLQSTSMTKQEKYWLNMFRDGVPLLNLPLDFQRTPTKNYEGDCINFSLEKGIIDGLATLAAETGSTLYTILFAAYSILLADYTGQKEMIIGVPVAGRNNPILNSIIGVFINTLPVKSKIVEDIAIPVFIRMQRDTILTAFDNQDYPIEELIDKLEMSRNLSRSPLIDTVFNMPGIDNRHRMTCDIEVIPFKYNQKVALFDIVLEAQEFDGEYDFCLLYDKKLFKRATMERLAARYMEIAGGFVGNKNGTVCSIL